MRFRRERGDYIVDPSKYVAPYLVGIANSQSSIYPPISKLDTSSMNPLVPSSTRRMHSYRCPHEIDRLTLVAPIRALQILYNEAFKSNIRGSLC